MDWLFDSQHDAYRRCVLDILHSVRPGNTAAPPIEDWRRIVLYNRLLTQDLFLRLCPAATATLCIRVGLSAFGEAEEAEEAGEAGEAIPRILQFIRVCGNTSCKNFAGTAMPAALLRGLLRRVLL